MNIKKYIKRILLKNKGIVCDKESNINMDVQLSGDFSTAIIIDSNVHIASMGDRCFIEHVYGYGNIELGKCVSISGPGTVLHSELGKIIIGSFTSIAPNVCIMDFNHDIRKATIYAINYNLFGEDLNKDFVSKGDVMIGEDVWVGANVVITSGVKIGRGAVIAAGAVVNKDVEPYSVVGGVPARLIKMRFEQKRIEELEESRWWEWNIQRIIDNRSFFDQIGKITNRGLDNGV